MGGNGRRRGLVDVWIFVNCVNSECEAGVCRWCCLAVDIKYISLFDTTIPERM